jgi:Zn-dependent protease/predicted transcriptional regulator
MTWSLTLGAVRGIKIRVHGTLLLIIAWAAYNWGMVLRGGWSGAAYGVALTFAVFFCVVVHELAHSLVALRFGVGVHDIELSPIGGLARMDSMPHTPSHELSLAVAGPLANLLLAVPLGILIAVLIGSRSFKSLGHLLYLMRKPSLEGFVLNLFATNVFLALFNLIPAFPMDGGRILRSLLTWAIGPSAATDWAASIGQWLSIIMGLAGLLVGNLILALVAAFVFVSARQEQQLFSMQAILVAVPVGDALNTAFSTLSPLDTLDVVLERTKRGQPAPFVVLEGSTLAGLLTAADITTALETYGSGALVGHIMRQDLPAVSPGDTSAHAYQLMARSDLPALPVMQDGQLVGLVTAQHIQQVHSFLSAKQRRRSHSLDL